MQCTPLPHTTQEPDRLSDDIISENDPVTRAVMSVTAHDRLPVTQLSKTLRRSRTPALEVSLDSDAWLDVDDKEAQMSRHLHYHTWRPVPRRGSRYMLL